MLKKLKFQSIPKMYYFDYFIFIPFFLLCIIGILMVYSASSINLSYAGMSTTTYLKKQILYVILGIIIVNIFARGLTFKKILESNVMVALLWVFVFGGLVWAKVFGEEINGAKGWINLGAFSIQPAEVAKLFFILFIARIFQNRVTTLGDTRFQFKFKDYGFILSILLLIGFTPDVGGLAINVAIIIVMLITVKAPKQSTVIAGVALSGGLVFLAVLFFKVKNQNPLKGTRYEYASRRFEGVFDPFGHVLTSGKQLVNSYYAISNGGLFGSGIGNGIQKRGYLPEPHTDFILSVLAEEMGTLGILLVLGLLLMIIIRILVIGFKAKTLSEMLACYGISTFLTVESLFNVGAVVGILPITGVTYPFVSYGGSSMVVLTATIGIAMSISNNQKIENNHEDKLDNNVTMELIKK